MNVRSWHTKQEIVFKGHHMYHNRTNHLLCAMSKYVLQTSIVCYVNETKHPVSKMTNRSKKKVYLNLNLKNSVNKFEYTWQTNVV